MYCCGPEELIENNLSVQPLTDNKKAGSNIMINIRATKRFHQKRLPILYDTWLTVTRRWRKQKLLWGEGDKSFCYLTTHPTMKFCC